MRNAGRFFACLIVFGAIAPAIAADRTADEILKDFDALKLPSTAAIQKAKGAEQQKLVQEYLKARSEINAKQADLIGELFKADASHARLATLLPQRWMILAQINKGDEANTEIDRIVAESKDEKLKAEAMFAKTRMVMMKEGPDSPATLAAIEAFQKSAPKDARVPQMLMSTLGRTPDADKKKAMEDRILKDFADSRTAKAIQGQRRQADGVGKPFELEFTDAIKGTTVSMKDLKGKVVVIDFWATWCGPCIAEIPNMKRIYAEYKDKGVEFIGVSLDQNKEAGGLDKLKDYVAKNDVQWLQYYQGNYWESEFSTSWGINAIPAVFIVDADGNLHSTQARGKLETLIPELLKKAKSNPGAGGQ